MRTQWLRENKRLVSQDNFGNDLAAVEAAMKKHEAIESDIYVSELPADYLEFKSRQHTDICTI
jgi:hypothetical protein